MENSVYQDIKSIYTRARLWSHLGWSDIKQKYNGSFLGPFWITLSLSIFLIALGIVYTKLLHQPLETYVPFLTCGLIAWTYISGIAVDGCDVFIQAKPFIHQIKLPLPIYVYRTVWRHLVIMLHNLAVYVAVSVIFHIPINHYTLLIIPGLFMVTLIMCFACLLLAIIGTRYRDIPPIVTSMIQVLFFVSPITWIPNMIGKSSLVVKLNPISYLVELIRAPLLGKPLMNHTWEASFIILIVTATITLFSFRAKRTAIPFWL